jgi:hypothetical protein
MDELTKQRLKQNETVFRAVNDEIDDLGAPDSRIAYVCECADVSCSETVRLDRADYRRIQAQRGHFVVVPGHEVPEIEDVVERDSDHLVVDKS